MLRIRIETLYLLVLLLLNSGTCYLVQQYGFYGSAVMFKPLTNPEQSTLNLAVLLAGYGALYFLVIRPSVKPQNQRPRPRARIDFWYSIIIGINWIIFLTTGIGVAGTSTQSIGFLVNMLPIAPLMLIYFADRGSRPDTHYLFNLLTGSLLILLRGWSAIVVVMVIIHIFDKIKIVHSRNAPKIALLTLATVLSYNYLYILKYYIREGVLFESNFLIAAEYAVSRVTAFQNYDYLSSITPEFLPHITGDSFFYIKEFILAFFPKSLIGYSDYKPLDNIFATQFVAEGIDGMEATGFAVTLPGVFKLAAATNPINYLIFPLFTIALYRIIFSLCSTIWCSRIRYYFIVTAFNLYYSGNMREFAFCVYALMIYIGLAKLPLYKIHKRKTESNRLSTDIAKAP